MHSKTNPIFRFAVETHHRVSVQIGDKMDLICPRYDDQMDHNGHMYHRIYQVTEEAFRLVLIWPSALVFMFLVLNTTSKNDKLTA